ncbi:MAG: hypothetical protein J7604_08655 [Sporocytophaga sp.]|uniref:hypothetical protein n=1 Tax=Sporocytophaga sp. TaxID=2231183 RepID=UPI001B142599|nr:hypothetical protein [Sporocytophaga sp.]MBO9700267.1 hypothetical protein [Sporocytophaga sp.]
MNRFRKNVLLGFSAIAVIFSVSCKRDKHPENLIGPEYKNADPGFYVVNNSFTAAPSDLIDFTKTQVGFNAQFSQEVTYFLTLRSEKGASVTFTDKAADLSKVKWDGGHNGLYFFNANDKVFAELSFLGSNVKLQDTLTVKTPKSYGRLVEDFEAATPGHLKFPAGWYTFGKEASAKAVDEDKYYNGVVAFAANNPKTIQPPSGIKYFKVMGTDANVDFFIDGAGFISRLNLVTANTDSIYFNMFVYGTGNVSDKGSIKIGEDDNGKGGVQDLVEDELFYDFKINWTGWKLVSVKYSDFSFTAANTGNRIREPKKAGKMGFALLSDPSGAKTSLIFDYPIFTYGKPLPQN